MSCTALRAVSACALLLTLASAQVRDDDVAAWPDSAVLERALGKKALRIEGEQVLHFYGWRRTVPVVWQQRPVEVFEGISLRTSFQRAGDECLVSGEWLLFVDETIPVVAALSEGGLRVTSLLPRFPGAEPQPFLLRFMGEGSENELGPAVATGMRLVNDRRQEVMQPPAGLPTSAEAGASAIHERPLEDLFGCKAEVKDGVALFRFPGPKGLFGHPPGARMGIARKTAFAGSDARARARLDWSVERRDLAKVLRELASAGFALESLAAAATSFDDELVQVNLVGSGTAFELAHAVQATLQLQRSGEGLAAEASFTPPALPEVLGIAQGKLADGWRSDATHPGGDTHASWAVTSGSDARARMIDPGTWSDRTFNLMWTDRVRVKDGRLVLRMRADRGRVDQGGGLIWRARDADNYYVTRFNPLEQDFRVYRVVKGVREQLQALGELPYRSQDWFTIEVVQRGDRITCTLNGREVLEVRDATFPDAGGIGVWSKADSQCSVAGLYLETFDAGTAR
ncbi:MAG: DUF1259 domain-containing protein [Planctomycetota bacterium]